MIGLGTGTLAAYGRAGDVYRFYDINPDVIAVANSEFTFLADSDAKIELALGDARLNLEREPPQNFDVLAVDAFSSDSIPVHLITKEALGVYLRHLKPEGIVAFHVSNRFLKLAPVVARLAKEHGAYVVAVDADTGAVVAGTFAGWTCSPADLPTRFDGSYVFERLPVGRSYISCLTSFTPDTTALSAQKFALVASAIMNASVVLPVPGGSQKMSE